MDLSRANKTKSFYLAIMNPNNHWSDPVLDRHAVAVYMGRVVSDRELRLLDSYKVYSKVEKAYLKACKVVGINRHMLQAITWTQWRENKGLLSKVGNRQLAIE